MARTIITCADCGQERLHQAKGLCQKCYYHSYYVANSERVRKQVREYQIDHAEEIKERAKRYQSENSERLAQYRRSYYTENRERWAERAQIIGLCAECGRERPDIRRGLCRTCYHHQENLPTIICADCGQERSHRAKGLCRTCYIRLWARQDRGKNPLLGREAAKRWRTKHPEWVKEIGRAFRNRHRGRISQRRRDLYAADPEKFRQYRAEWRRNNPDKVKAIKKRSHLSDRMSSQRRRSRTRSLPFTLTAEQWAAIVAAYKGKCAYCGKANLKLTQDHVVPVSRGGGYEIGNIVPACRPCNSRKSVGPPLNPVQTLLM